MPPPAPSSSGGFDYHTGERATGEARDFSAGQCIGAVLQYAAIQGKPVMIYIFSDGSLASDGTIDSSVGGRGKGVWTADNQNVAATYFLVYDPKAKPTPAQTNAGDEPAARLLQSRRLAEHDLEPGRQQRAESGADGGAQLHGAARHRRLASLVGPNLWPNTPTNNTLGSGAAALDPLIMYNPLASLENGKVPG